MNTKKQDSTDTKKERSASSNNEPGRTSKPRDSSGSGAKAGSQPQKQTASGSQGTIRPSQE